jgi:hypothetical protein
MSFTGLTRLRCFAGGSTEEAQAAIGVDVAAKLIAYINNGKTIGAVNFPEVDLPPNPQVSILWAPTCVVCFASAYFSIVICIDAFMRTIVQLGNSSASES